MSVVAGRVSWRSVALPSEHGGWSLTAEPALLGLLVAWSWPGLALGVAAMVAFVARTPLKLVLVDRWRHRRLDRTRLAASIAAVELVVLAMLSGYAIWAGEPGFWVPLAVAAPLVILELWYDMRSRGRRLVPELAGTVGIGAVAAAIALAGGETERVAWGLWVVMAARSIAAVPYVRAQILRARSRPGPRWHSDLGQLIAVLLVAVAWASDLVPGPAAIAIGALAVIDAAALRMPPKPAVVIGIQQTVFGVLVIVTTAIAVAAS
ncbi:MAG TPA: YwiC-like family protein [Acidimicrobiales bacterium]|nr:YwiC-like family protein [Acidimicrobiales bacterium]